MNKQGMLVEVVPARVRLALEASQAGAAPVAQTPKRKPRSAADARAAAGGGA